MSSEDKKVGEKIIEEMEKMARALEQIPTKGFLRRMLVLYLRERTGLEIQKIESILDAMIGLKKEMEREMKEE